MANPVNAFLIVKRLTSDWNYVESLMGQNAAESTKTYQTLLFSHESAILNFKAFLQNITSQRDTTSVKFPEREDLNGAAAALFRLQDTYQLSTHDVADGLIQGVKRADDMTGTLQPPLSEHL